MKKLLSAIVMAVFAIGCITAQTSERTVKGYVIDKNGNPIPGAEVSATGGAETTITDSDGSFSLQVPPFLKSLTATYTGMGSKKMKVNFNSDMIFTMKPKDSFGFLSAVGCFSAGGDLIGGGGGLMGGMLGKWGFYAKATIDNGVCPVVTAGVIKSFSKSVYGFLGVGYGMVAEYYEDSYSYYNYDTDSYYSYTMEYTETYGGMALDLGCIFKVSRHFNIIVGDTFATDFAGSLRNTVNVGVGYVF